MAEEKKTSKVKATKKVVFLGTGRRKKSIARVTLQPGNGAFTVNDVTLDEYFPLDTLKLIARQSLVLTNSQEKYDVAVSVEGGGLTGQAGAILHGVSRALLVADETLKAELKKAGFLTRDSRMKERKKYGLKKARKAPQFSKR